MHLFQVGAGSGGIVVLDLLARDRRVKRITIVEPDIYREHNVYRHVFPPSSVGLFKVDLAAGWVAERRPDVKIDAMRADLTDPSKVEELRQYAKECDVGICAVDNEPAKYAFDALMREMDKPWTLGEVLSGGIGGWAHQFQPRGACYGCVASHLQRNVTETPAEPVPDYSNPGARIEQTTVPASKSAIEVIAGLHAMRTLDLFEPWAAENNLTSLLFTLVRVPGVFDDAYRSYRFRIPRSTACLICTPAPGAREDLDVALDQAFARLVKE